MLVINHICTVESVYVYEPSGMYVRGGAYLGIGCKQPWGRWELNLSPLDKQSVFLTTEPSP